MRLRYLRYHFEKSFLKRLDMYHDLKFDEKEKANVKITEEDFNAR